MDEKHRKLLQKHRIAIAKDLDPLGMFGHLAKLDTFTADDEEDIKSISSRSGRVERLLDILPRKGEGAFECFVRALEKESPHLAKPLLLESGLSPCTQPEEELGMSHQHKKILRESRPQLQVIDVKKMLPKLKILNTDEKERIMNCNSSLEKVDKLIEILIRKGPNAFEHFVTVLKQFYPEEAKCLVENGLSSGSEEKPPIQVTNPQVSGSALVQDLLKERKLDDFINCLDIADVFGNDWKMLYKELELPMERISVFEEKDHGSPTRNMLTAWCQRCGDSANVLTLLQAMSRCNRGDCLQQLENDLGCKLLELELSRRISRLGFEQADGEGNRFEFLKDLSEHHRHTISSNIPADKTEFIKKKLEEEVRLESGSALTVKNILQKCGNIRIRDFMEILKNCECKSAIKEVRKFLPAGTTGPLLGELTNVRDVSYNVRRDVTMALSGNNDIWRSLGAALNIPNQNLDFINARSDNPGDEVLKFWEVKAGSRVGILYDILVRIGYPMIADKL